MISDQLQDLQEYAYDKYMDHEEACRAEVQVEVEVEDQENPTCFDKYDMYVPLARKPAPPCKSPKNRKQQPCKPVTITPRPRKTNHRAKVY